MSVKCVNCGEKEFKILESIWEEIDLKEQFGKITKGMTCCNCGNPYIIKMNIEIKSISAIDM